MTDYLDRALCGIFGFTLLLIAISLILITSPITITMAVAKSIQNTTQKHQNHSGTSSPRSVPREING